MILEEKLTKQIIGEGIEVHRHLGLGLRIEANDALGQNLTRLCFEGPEEELGLTINTQPAILVVSMAILEVLKHSPLDPDFAAGHSLGEYSALTASGVLSFSEAVKAVRERVLN